ncbi:MAG: N-acetylneuraminate synthase family protein [Syntrophomonadaceae bacterium]
MRYIGQPLFIFEMANNHQGSVENGLEIIRQVASVCKEFEFDFAFKFQYRDLDSFIHPAFMNNTENKHVKRFTETRLTKSDLLRLKKEVKSQGFISICTPFDEVSVDLIIEHGFDIIKIASCSVGDWPLLEKIADAGKPVIASTAGSSLEEIDKLVNFFSNRRIDMVLMHCVAEYPTPLEGLQLNQIDLLSKRYSPITIGFSTHEYPDNYDAIKIAIAKQAKVFEKHVGINNPSYPLNSYSATPDQVRNWLNAARAAFSMCGIADERYYSTDKEQADLNSLRRGIFARNILHKGQKLNANYYYLAFPAIEGQMVAQDLSKYHEIVMIADEVAGDAPIMRDQVKIIDNRPMIERALGKVLKLVNEGNIVIPIGSASELSHHTGLANFDQCGATIINCLNREYCKKFIIVLPDQSHPVHSHRLKEETFTVVYGEMNIEIDGQETVLKIGESITIDRGAKHRFSSTTGAIMEELSTTHYTDDSYYDDDAINQAPHRKTAVYLTSEFFGYRGNKA